jgi:hypothetical protein
VRFWFGNCFCPSPGVLPNENKIPKKPKTYEIHHDCFRPRAAPSKSTNRGVLKQKFLSFSTAALA